MSFINALNNLIRDYANINYTQNQEKKEIVPVGQNVRFTVNDQVLPDEITMYVFGFLSERGLEAVGQVCKHWRHLASDNSFWEGLSFARGLGKKPEDQKSYQEFYRNTIKQDYFSLINGAILPLATIASKEKELETIGSSLNKKEATIARKKLNDSAETRAQYRIDKLVALQQTGRRLGVEKQTQLARLQAGDQKEIQNYVASYEGKLKESEKALKRKETCREDLTEEIIELNSKKDLLRAALIKELQGTSLFSRKEIQQKLLKFLETTVSELSEQRKNKGILSLISSWVTNAPQLNAELLFIILAQSNAIFFLKDLIEEGKAIVPTSEICASLKIDLISRAVKGQNHAMLKYLLSLGIPATQKHLKKAIEKLDVESVELLLKAGAPVSGKNFIFLLINTTRYEIYKYSASLITSQRIQLFKLLCQASSTQGRLPEKWNKYRNLVYVYSMNVFNFEMEQMRQLLERQIQQPFIEQRSETDYALIPSYSGGLPKLTYEVYADNVQTCNKMINEAKAQYSLLIAKREIMNSILPNGFAGELRAAGLLPAVDENSSNAT